MADVTIPLYNDTTNYSVSVQLNDVTYTLSFRYNTRMDTWILSIGDISDSPILGGVPLLTGPALLDQFLSYNIPPGALVIFNTEDNNIQPTLDTFAQLFNLYYRELA